MSAVRTVSLVLFFAGAALAAATSNSKNSTLACFFEENVIECAAQRIDAQLDEVQSKDPVKPGQPREPPISQVIADTRSVLVQGIEAVDAVLTSDADTEDTTVQDEDAEDSRDIGEARKKKFGKKKKKALQKILMVAMVLKAKLSLLIQLFSAHLQVKFFAISLLSLLLNLARFWLDLKNKGQPQKVIYYEHAQHQHHYEHEDDHSGYWGRSADDAHELAYGAHHDEQVPEY
ncbi:uncharacterized protein [Neodiprion pinetum]|uniref:Uncharacterized protein LOC107224425 n=1 Tax=Neodiprion lecontei TaxID=441921 RepID=A0A6J0C052_NEOLC|nr:uncharacterized protein LOC107224425 [Neodiprion lecontei]XP_046482667.1 uncharacterized protein LOC124219326 [Neodiprion pinetum]XP_046620077.1 uncharacterized protein LOC124305094 [Neodiprion virginianus]